MAERTYFCVLICIWISVCCIKLTESYLHTSFNSFLKDIRKLSSFNGDSHRILTDSSILSSHTNQLGFKSLSKDIRQQALHQSESDDTSLTSFSDYETIPSWLTQRCQELGFKNPNLVQQSVLPSIFSGKDVVLQAQTGSGKTLVYALPILSQVDPTRASIQAVIIVPTRELGLQVCTVLKRLASGSPSKIMIMPLFEGSNNRRQQLWAVAEPPHILVGNPKSLQKLVDNGRLRLNSVSFVVLDEVDACLSDNEIRQDLHQLLSRKLSNTFKALDSDDDYESLQQNLVYSDLSKKQRDMEVRPAFRQHRQTIMCSATIPQRQHFASICFKNGWTLTMPELIHVSSKDLVPQQVVHEYVECPVEQRFSCLKYLIEKELSSLQKHVSESKPTKSTSKLRQFINRRKQESSDKVSNTVGSESSDLQRDISGKFQVMVFFDDSDMDFSSSNEMVSLRLSKYGGGYENPRSESDSQSLNNLIVSLEKIFDFKRNSENATNRFVEVLSESMSLDQRVAALNSFREGNSSVLLCTTCAARGIDIPNITHVIQMSLPKTADDYIHQVGRVGRMGKDGKAITIISPGSEFVINRYSNEIGVPINKRNLKVKVKQA